MVDLKYVAQWDDHGANKGGKEFANTLDKITANTKTLDRAQVNLAAAEVKGKTAAHQLEQAQAKLAAVTSSETATAKELAAAQLAVEKAQVAVARSAVDHHRASEDLTLAQSKSEKSALLSGVALKGLGVAAAGSALAFGAMVSVTAGFDKQISNVGAVSGASADELLKLRDAALKAGADTAFSAGQAAEAEGELAKAGVSTSDILGGALSGALSLAAAGQLGLGDAASIAAQAMTIFKLKGTDVGHIADVLAAGANKSTADVSGLGTSLTYAGSTAAAMGLSIEDTVGTLALFSNHAINGSEAGTGLRGVLASLVRPSNDAATTMRQAGLNAFDSGGKFVGLANFAQQLKDKLGPLSQAQREQALVTIFGREQLGAATALYEEGGAGVKKYTAAVNENGAAANVAARNMDNLAGDVEALKGSLETAFIKTGSAATGILRKLTGEVTGAVNAFAALPGPVQAGALSLLALVGGTTGLLTVIGTVAPKVREARTALSEMGSVGKTANKALGVIGTGLQASLPLIGAAAIGWQIYANQQQQAREHVESLTEAIKADSGALGEHTRATLTAELEQRGFLKAAEDAGLSAKTLTDAILGNAGAQKQLSDAISSGKGDRFELIAAYTQEQDALSKSGEASRRKAEAEAAAVPPAKDLNTATDAVTASLKEEVSAADQVKNAIDALNSGNIDAATADIAYRNSVDAVTKSIKDNGTATDLGSAKGRDNISVILSAIKAAETHGQAIATQTNSAELGTAAFKAHVDALRRTLLASHLTQAEVKRLLDTYAQTPDFVVTTVGVDTAVAARNIKAIQDKINRTHGKNLQVNVTATGIDRVTREIDAITGHAVSIQAGTRGHGGEARAIGGPVRAGDPYLVGEHGPELLVPDRNGTIVPMSTGARTGIGLLTPPAVATRTYNISVSVAPGGHPADVGSQIVKLIRTYEERSGAGWRG